MRRLQLLTMMLALLWSASAFGQEVAEEPATAARTFGVNVACGASGAPYPAVAGCSLQRRLLTLGDFELAVGFDGQLAFDPDRWTYVAPLVGLAYFGPKWGAFVEIIMPAIIPSRTPWQWRAGFSTAF